MPEEIGFVILSHRGSPQLLRLTRCLSTVYPGCTIACHHDFDQAPLNTADFGKNVAFVHPHYRTRWGTISLPIALIAALRTLYERSSPGWFITLSEMDYPIKPRETVEGDLVGGKGDVYIHHKLLRYSHRAHGMRARVNGGQWISHEHEDWPLLALDRYLDLSSIAQRPVEGIGVSIRMSSGVPQNQTAFSNPNTLALFAGDQWFSARRSAAEILLGHQTQTILAKFSNSHIPDEIVYQTILCNTDLTIVSDNYRYSDWTAGGPHPKSLTCDDLECLRNSKAHFARKVPSNTELPDAIDQMLLGFK
jgi:Core-2/I-Branching enzyme